MNPAPECILTQDFRFEAAHRLPQLPPTHKCARLHGHSFHLTVTVKGPIDPKLGWVLDYAEIERAVQPVLDRHFDHHYLNEVPGLENPTSENICRFLWDKLRPSLPLLHEIKIAENCDTACIYRA